MPITGAKFIARLLAGNGGQGATASLSGQGVFSSPSNSASNLLKSRARFATRVFHAPSQPGRGRVLGRSSNGWSFGDVQRSTAVAFHAALPVFVAGFRPHLTQFLHTRRIILRRRPAAAEIAAARRLRLDQSASELPPLLYVAGQGTQESEQRAFRIKGKTNRAHSPVKTRIRGPASVVILDDALEGDLTSVVHVGRRSSYLAQRGRLECAAIGGNACHDEPPWIQYLAVAKGDSERSET